jgi:hypothetical protein
MSVRTPSAKPGAKSSTIARLVVGELMATPMSKKATVGGAAVDDIELLRG